MVRIEAASRPATTQGYAPREAAAARPETGRAVVALPAPGNGPSARPWTRGDGRPQAGFVAHLIVSTDPTLTPSRAERAQRACGAYAAAARQVA